MRQSLPLVKTLSKKDDLPLPDYFQIRTSITSTNVNQTYTNFSQSFYSLQPRRINKHLESLYLNGHKLGYINEHEPVKEGESSVDSRAGEEADTVVAVAELRRQWEEEQNGGEEEDG